MLKRLRTWMLIISCICVSTNSWAALQADTAWEVRTTGVDTNGGCYDTGGGGTDYTQQDAAQYAPTDLAQTLSSTTLTSAAAGFTEGMANNCIQITGAGTGAFTTGFYEIITYTNTSTVVLDRTACSTANCSGGTGAVGGALLTIQKAADGVSGANNRVWIKAGTYNELLTVKTQGGTGSRSAFIGYNTTRGDDPVGANRPVIDAQSTRANCITSNGDLRHFLFMNLICQNATSHGVGWGSGNSTNIDFYNFKSASNGGIGIGGMSWGRCIYCELNNNTTGGTSEIGSHMASYIHDNSGYGVSETGGGTVEFTITDSNAAGVGIKTGSGTVWLNNVAYNNAGASSDGFDYGAAGSSGSMNRGLNNISKDNGRYGFNNSVNREFYLLDYNISNGHTTEINGYTNLYNGNHDIGDVDPLFTDAAAGDFTVTTGSPALGAGVSPDVFTAVTGDYKINVGVDQDDVAAGGSVTVGYSYGQ